jgi:hypothetical protein
MKIKLCRIYIHVGLIATLPLNTVLRWLLAALDAGREVINFYLCSSDKKPALNENESSVDVLSLISSYVRGSFSPRFSKSSGMTSANDDMSRSSLHTSNVTRASPPYPKMVAM